MFLFLVKNSILIRGNILKILGVRAKNGLSATLFNIHLDLYHFKT